MCGECLVSMMSVLESFGNLKMHHFAWQKAQKGKHLPEKNQHADRKKRSNVSLN